VLSEETFDTGEVSLNIMRGPANGPPLVLFHGVLRRWSDFLPLLPALTTRWQVFAVDFRGHGESGFTTGNYRVVDYVHDAVAVIRELLTEPCVIYGHSLGAMVAAGAAAQAADRVRAVVLEDPTPELAARLAEMKLRVPGKTEPVRFGDLRDACSLRYIASCLHQIDPDVLTPIVEGRWLEEYDWEKTLSGIHCPALLMQADGEAGGMLTSDDAQRARELIADCTLVSFPRTGHLLHWMATTELLRYVTNFLESLR
jgi:pimeloyl-ACP methyl ester carboxylesterase